MAKAPYAVTCCYTLGKTTWTKFDEFSENFQTASFSENYVALFATKFFGVQRPHPISLPKKRNEIFWIGNDPPPLGSFPKIHRIWSR